MPKARRSRGPRVPHTVELLHPPTGTIPAADEPVVSLPDPRAAMWALGSGQLADDPDAEQVLAAVVLGTMAALAPLVASDAVAAGVREHTTTGHVIDLCRDLVATGQLEGPPA